MNQSLIKELTAVEHIRLLPQMYIGSMNAAESTEIILKENKFQKESISYVPALLKIINEALDNSIDEAIKTKFQFGNKIKISISDTDVTIEDNGRGIPVIQSKESGEYMPVMAFCNVRAGSNFDKVNEGTSSIGTHGIGIKATNIFSTLFEAETSDGKNKLSLTCRDNMESIDFSIKECSSTYTKIHFRPDLSRFGLSSIDEAHSNMIYQRILFLSYSFPEIKFYFNNERVNIGNSKQFMSMFSDSFELFSEDNWFIGVYPNEEEDFSFFSYVNGLYLKRGGTHIDVISNELSYKIRDSLMKKYKTIKPGDVKNKLSIVVFFKNFPSMQFDSQTKETLTNSIFDIKKFLNLSNDDFLDMTKKIMKNEAILEPIVEMFKLKEEFKKRQALKNLSSGKKRITSESYFPPIGDKKYLMLTEGFSATSSMWNILGRRNIAYYSLRGKPLNTFNVPVSKMIANKEFKDIIDVLNLNLLDKETDMDYEKIIFLSDQDSDGIHIRSLLLTFFYKFTPKMIEDGRIFFMNTPLLIQFDKRDKPVNWFFTIEEYNDFVEKNPDSSSLRTKYYKGLGSFNPLELSEVIEKVGSMENFFTQFTKTVNSEKSIKEWMSSGESNARKECLTGRSFNLSSI